MAPQKTELMYYLRWLLGGFFIFFLGSTYAATDKIIAIVNDHVVTQSELNLRSRMLQQHLGQNATTPLPSKSAVKQKALDDLIDRELQLQMAKRNNVKIGESEIDHAITNITQRNQITLAQLQQELQKQGIKYSNFRQQLHDDMLIGRIEQQVLGSKIQVSEQEVDHFLRTAPNLANTVGIKVYHTIDILIPVKENAGTNAIVAAKKVALALTKKLGQGITIEQAIKETTFNGEPLQSNDLGWRTVHELPAIFVETVTKLQPQTISEPITAPNGIHIIKLLEIRGRGNQQQLAKPTRGDAREMVYRQKLEKALKPWIRQLRATAYIKIFANE